MIFRKLDVGKLSVIGLSTNIEFFLHKYIGSTEQRKGLFITTMQDLK